ncbi:hypothetical protein TKK_0015591 [Trichogramma kaykai]
MSHPRKSVLKKVYIKTNRDEDVTDYALPKAKKSKFVKKANEDNNVDEETHSDDVLENCLVDECESILIMMKQWMNLLQKMIQKK